VNYDSILENKFDFAHKLADFRSYKGFYQLTNSS
jgi:hypothetical protein